MSKPRNQIVMTAVAKDMIILFGTVSFKVSEDTFSFFREAFTRDGFLGLNS